jgi:hypothetical protein
MLVPRFGPVSQQLALPAEIVAMPVLPDPAQATSSGSAPCGSDCTSADKLGLDFSFAYQPIVGKAMAAVGMAFLPCFLRGRHRCS